jgi:hypothetical protein
MGGSGADPGFVGLEVLGFLGPSLRNSNTKLRIQN